MAVLTFCILAFGLALSIPIFVVFAGTAFLVFAFTSPIPLSILPQRVFAGLESFPLLAIPFFFFAATIMSKGGLSRRLIDFVQTLVGHLPGGLAMTAVLTCTFFGAITGSSASTIVAIGSILFPALVTAGYSERFALGVVTCSALIGMIIPPSNAMIIYGAIANVSIGALFMSGIGAGMLFAFAYCCYCVTYAVATGVPRTPRATFVEVWQAVKDVIWGLGLPGIILGGIYGGVFTATEAAAVSVVYASVVCLFIYRELDFKGFCAVAVEAGLNSARILILVAAASLFSWLITVSGTATQIASPLQEYSGSPTTLMTLINGLALFTGMFIDVFSNILILVPILLSVTTAAGVSPTHLGIIMTVNVDIGNVTPPFGLNLFVASGTFNRSYTQIVLAVLPWLLIAVVCLVLITIFPEISLWLPRQLYPSLI